jgi:hypothetical protein
MSTKSRESLYGSDIRMSAERAAEARKKADQLACVAWNMRMLGWRFGLPRFPPLDPPSTWWPGER